MPQANTCGLIIHEGQLAYVIIFGCFVDLGKWWNNADGLHHLANVLRRDLGEKVMEDITKYTKKSIEFAISNPDEALEFAKNGQKVLTNQAGL